MRAGVSRATTKAASSPDAQRAKAAMRTHAQVALETLRSILVGGAGANRHGRGGALERAHVDGGAAVSRNLLAKRVDRSAEICRKGNLHGDLCERLPAADRGVPDRIGGQFLVW